MAPWTASRHREDFEPIARCHQHLLPFAQAFDDQASAIHPIPDAKVKLVLKHLPEADEQALLLRPPTRTF
jgi:hypothetical protein